MFQPKGKNRLCASFNDYNENRPHSMLGYKTPAEVAEQLRKQ